LSKELPISSRTGREEIEKGMRKTRQRKNRRGNENNNKREIC
jgi:hypothetical protein